jgi:hypothetical protein
MFGFQAYYFTLKGFFLFAIVRSLVRFAPLEKHVLSLSVLYTAAVAFLSYVFMLSPLSVVYWQKWGAWLAITFALSFLYFQLLVRFDEGPAFVILLLLGVGLVLF